MFTYVVFLSKGLYLCVDKKNTDSSIVFRGQPLGFVPAERSAIRSSGLFVPRCLLVESLGGISTVGSDVHERVCREPEIPAGLGVYACTGCYNQNTFYLMLVSLIIYPAIRNPEPRDNIVLHWWAGSKTLGASQCAIAVTLGVNNEPVRLDRHPHTYHRQFQVDVHTKINLKGRNLINEKKKTLVSIAVSEGMCASGYIRRGK